MNTVIVIPALNPDEKLIKLVEDLKKDFKKIIIVNDGSNSDIIFKKLKNCIVLTHDVNKGKGEALKTAFKYYQENLIKKNTGIITMDADGQHIPTDAIKLSEVLENSNQFVLGTRLFNTKSTPLRNKIGNRITSRVFKWFYKVYLKDTQTGLRGVPNRLISPLIKVDGSRFEYELNVLIKLVQMKEEIKQVDIKTVYLKHSNKKSHFKVLKDSIRIYKTMLKGKKKDL